jgi:phosphoglycolate phosphatase-like HAD superfamily hydrolase
MFDIDGTLTDTNVIDGSCFIQALQEVFGFTNVNDDWSSYRHTSDSGIIDELFQRRLQRSPVDAELTRFQNRFVELLSAVCEKNSFAITQISGAENVLKKLINHDRYAIALATGGWKKSALFKLQKAGLPNHSMPAAYADDAHAREDIMKCSLKRAHLHYKQNQFDAVIYVGDGVWDVRASKHLEFKFIGIGSDHRASRLKAEGATHIFADYLDADSFCAAINELCQTN